jgi:hypothetical protein
MIESLANIYVRSIEMIRIVTFIAITIPLLYVMFKLYVKLVKAILHKD